MAKKKIVIQRKKIAPVKKKRELTEEAKQKLRDRLAAMRAKKKPANYKNIAKSVLNLPDDDKYSFKNVKEWIKHSKDLVSEYNKTARSRATTSQESQKASNAADHKKVYIRELENYLKTGDWISYFSGQDENQKVIPRCVAMAYDEQGRAKRSEGVFYPDISAVWTRDMDEDMFPDMREDTNYVPKKSGTVAITDRQFDDSL
jgi:hypothetical protein